MSQLVLTDGDVDIREYLTPKMIKVYNEVEDKIGMYEHDHEWIENGITNKDRYIRIKFWEMLKNCTRENKSLSIRSLCDGFTNKQTFYNMLANPTRAAFFYTRPINIVVENKFILEKANEQIHNILKMSSYDDNGKVIGAIVNAKIKIWKESQDRTEGSIINRVQQHQVIENKTGAKPLSISDIDRQIAELEGSQHVVIETTPVAPESE